MTKFNKSEVLELLDRCADENTFPMLNNTHVRHAGIRLHVFGSEAEWLIVFDWFFDFVPAGTFSEFVDAFGSELPDGNLSCNRSDPVELPDQEDLYDELGNYKFDRFHFELLINKELRSFTPTREDYLAAGFDVDDGQQSETQIIRYLEHQLGDELYAPSPEALLNVCGREDAGLTQLLYLKEYYHPNVADDEYPSDTETFRMIADVLVSRDPSRHHPSEASNTHWSHWVRK
jgi:hypothetical protein